jgi:hypothetical protein
MTCGRISSDKPRFACVGRVFARVWKRVGETNYGGTAAELLRAKVLTKLTC